MDHAITERPTIVMQKVESSQLHSIGHHPESNTLAITFLNKDKRPGSTYHYANYTPELFAGFQAAESKGTHFGKYIKNAKDKHPYVKVS